MSLLEHPTIFERGVTGADVEEWVLALLHKWSGTYLSETERQHGVEAGTLARVRSFTIAADFDKWVEQQVPAVIVISPGLVPPPEMDGAGWWTAWWRIDIGVICAARTQWEAHRYAQWYVHAHKWIMLQRPSLEGKTQGLRWLDESYQSPPFSFEDSRSLYAGYASFSVKVSNVAWAEGGPDMPDVPLDPDTLPWPLWQKVRSADVQIEHYPPPDPIPEEEE